MNPVSDSKVEKKESVGAIGKARTVDPLLTENRNSAGTFVRYHPRVRLPSSPTELPQRDRDPAETMLIQQYGNRVSRSIELSIAIGTSERVTFEHRVMHREGRGHGRGGRKQLLPHTALQKITVCPCMWCACVSP